MILNEWPNCIITMIDLIGIKIHSASGVASSKMIQMRNFAVSYINSAMPLHNHCYVWNDSILLIAYEIESVEKRMNLLKELREFKGKLEVHCGHSTYLVSVKGKAFPDDPFEPQVFNGQIGEQSRATVLKTSSWAMANCFKIEEYLKKHKADWYIDSRIIKDLIVGPPFATEVVSLLPKNKNRKINMYKDGSFL